MKPAFFRLLFSGITLLAVNGCVLSEQPLSAVKDARPDPRLVGIWRAVGKHTGGVGSVSFNRQGLGQVKVKDQDSSGKPFLASNSFFVTQTAKGSYINLMYSENGKQPKSPTYYEFYKYTLSRDHKRLHLRSIRPGIFEDGVKESKLKGRYVQLSDPKGFETLMLEDSSEAILRFIETRPANEVFVGYGSYRKVN